MLYTLLITASLSNISAHRRALMFADALLHQEHSIHTIFFYGEGAGIGLSTRDVNSTLYRTNLNWCSISEKGKTKLILCVSSALTQGVLDKTTSLHSKDFQENIATGFETGGLGSLVDAVANSDRLMSFGG